MKRGGRRVGYRGMDKLAVTSITNKLNGGCAAVWATNWQRNGAPLYVACSAHV